MVQAAWRSLQQIDEPASEPEVSHDGANDVALTGIEFGALEDGDSTEIKFGALDDGDSTEIEFGALDDGDSTGIEFGAPEKDAFEEEPEDETNGEDYENSKEYEDATPIVGGETSPLDVSEIHALLTDKPDSMDSDSTIPIPTWTAPMDAEKIAEQTNQLLRQEYLGGAAQTLRRLERMAAVLRTEAEQLESATDISSPQWQNLYQTGVQTIAQIMRQRFLPESAPAIPAATATPAATAAPTPTTIPAAPAFPAPAKPTAPLSMPTVDSPFCMDSLLEDDSLLQNTDEIADVHSRHDPVESHFTLREISGSLEELDSLRQSLQENLPLADDPERLHRCHQILERIRKMKDDSTDS